MGLTYVTNSIMNFHLFDERHLEPLLNTSLYYPCAGNDLEKPVRAFNSVICDFWFVDINYFRETNPADTAKEPIHLPQFKHIDKQILGPPVSSWEERVDNSGNRYRYLEPCTRTDIYEHNERIIKINRRRGDGYLSLFGPTTLPISLENLGIFFYRGDSFEGGTRKWWMSTKPTLIYRGLRVPLLTKVIERLCNYGLLVTDGSNNRWNSKKARKRDEQYSQLFRFNLKDITCKEAVKLAKSFTDENGNRFDCIGHVGKRYGPTLVWKITKHC